MSKPNLPPLPDTANWRDTRFHGPWYSKHEMTAYAEEAVRQAMSRVLTRVRNRSVAGALLVEDFREFVSLETPPETRDG